ncbi:MAG: class B sortase [Defluviitaleaceae bacterium]|nr:class B sortase [Defluviitaleaceae bacterium]
MKPKPKKKEIIIACIATAMTICAIVLAMQVLPFKFDVWKMKREQAQIPQFEIKRGDWVASDAVYLRLPAEIDTSFPNALDEEMRAINPDYLGMVRIDGTPVNFPVVRGAENEKYLSTTFQGAENVLGAIFMDSRSVGEYVPHIIIYGHQANDTGGEWLMFGMLNYFLNEQYTAQHPIITLMTNDTIAEFEIFSVRATDVYDPAYKLHVDDAKSFAEFLEANHAPADAVQILTLSTCIGAGNDRRLVVQGALKEIFPISFVEYGENGWNIDV